MSTKHLTIGQPPVIFEFDARRSLRRNLRELNRSQKPDAVFRASREHFDDEIRLVIEIDAHGPGQHAEVWALISTSTTTRKPILTLEDMIAAGSYAKVSKDFNDAPFPILPKRFTTIDAKIHHFGRRMEPKDIHACLEEDDRQLCYLETLLAYGMARPQDQNMFPIIGRSYSGKTPFLTADMEGRKVLVGKNTQAGGYREHCRFLSVPKAA